MVPFARHLALVSLWGTAVALPALAAPVTAKGTVINVRMGESVQAAVLRAKAGDTILVSGWHQEPVTLKSGLTLKGLSAAAGVQWSDGPAITVKDATGVRIEGLQIGRGGAAAGLKPNNGSIAIFNSRVTVSHCRIASGGDGVVVTGRSEVAIADNVIQGCGESGVLLLGQATGAVLNNQIQNNQLHGIAVGEQAHPTIAQNAVSHNAHAGIGYFGRARGECRGNLVSQNGRYGLLIEQQALPTVVQNTVIQHRGGPGIALRSHEAVRIGFNVLTWNEYGVQGGPGAQPGGVRDNLVVSNRLGDYEGLKPAAVIAQRGIHFTRDDGSYLLAREDGSLDEQFGWRGRQAAGAVLEPPPKLPPALSAVATLEEPSGNGALDGGEDAHLKLVVKNGGKGPATRVRVTLAATPANAALRYPTLATVGTIAPGQQKEVTLDVRGLEGLGEGRANFAIQVTDAFGFDAPALRLALDTHRFTPPQLAIRHVGAEGANGNGLLERGEQIDVQVVVANQGTGLAKRVQARFVSTDPRIKSLGDEVVTIGDLPPGRSKEARYSLLVPNRYDGPAQLPITVVVSEANPALGVSQALALKLNQASPAYVEAAVAPAASGPPPEPAFDVDVDKPVATRARNPQAVALVIGVERYNPGVPAVRFARRDAAIFREYLMTSLGVPESNIIYLTDEAATFGQIRTALEAQLPRWVEKGRSDVYVYFAGHGAPDMASRSPFLVPYDGNPAYPATSCYSLTAAYDALAKLGARSVTVCLDSCFSGQAGREPAPTPLLADARPLMITPLHDAVPPGLTVFAAAGGAQLSAGFARMKHGLFTYYWLKGLQGHADADGDRQVSVGELQRYLQPLVSQEARRQNREQTPVLLGDGAERVLVNLP